MQAEARFVSPAMKRTSDWILSQELPSDITIKVDDAAFNLHKLPLASRCGYIKKHVSGVGGNKATHLEIAGMPGGSKSFELVVKFCYGANFEITVDNVAMLRCAGEHLEMTEECRPGNLVGRTEAYLEEVALASLEGAVAVLRKAEELLPASEEKARLVARCIDAVASIVCGGDGQFSMSLGTPGGGGGGGYNGVGAAASREVDDWCADELTALRIDTFQRVMIAMKARGFKGIAMGTLIMLYAQKSLRRLDMHGRDRKKMGARQEHEKRVVLETIVSLLPRERNTMSVSFLSMLLRAAIHLDTTLACRLDLEKRMAAQLGQAVLDDLLIPSSSPDAAAATTAYDIDAVQRILAGYLDLDYTTDPPPRLDYTTDDDFSSAASPPHSDVAQVGRLMESYLAEIASDENLSVDKFTALAELIPERARFNEDGMYRAIDIYLKAHPSLAEGERKKVCRAMDCQKLSREACAHAAQNDRLPVQTVVQVLYHEQRRLRAPSQPPSAAPSYAGGESPALSYRPTPSFNGRHRPGVPDEVSRLQRENDELRMELLRMKMRLRDPSVAFSAGGVPPSGRPPLPKKPGGGGGGSSGGFMNSMSKKLGRLNPFLRSDVLGGGRVRTKPPKDRRHSIS
ncbi:BTB/POZ domain-containing protein SR1IP1 isoform X1 [Oryza glaberrima]|uniref:NPH3 domain-containing protein n=2 Tax=Oryza glaberrima TaxID=4538 RepID=I1P8P9_ORYGL|nr:BTB/POZ domain-containing protein SR1IP1 isoform X1 [Oryza glaberrima]